MAADSDFCRVCPFQDLKREVLLSRDQFFQLYLFALLATSSLWCVCPELDLALGTLKPQVDPNTGDFLDWHILALGCVASRRSILAEIGHSL